MNERCYIRIVRMALLGHLCNLVFFFSCLNESLATESIGTFIYSVQLITNAIRIRTLNSNPQIWPSGAGIRSWNASLFTIDQGSCAYLCLVVRIYHWIGFSQRPTQIGLFKFAFSESQFPVCTFILQSRNNFFSTEREAQKLAIFEMLVSFEKLLLSRVCSLKRLLNFFIIFCCYIAAAAQHGNFFF